MTDYKQHPLSAIFDPMPKDDFAALVEDIKEHAQLQPGVLYEGMVLDGWNRYLACKKAGIRFRAEKFAGSDPAAYVESVNLHRKHYTASQRAGYIVKTRAWRPAGVQNSMVEPGSTMPSTNKEMAAAAGVTDRTIRDAKAAEKAGLGDQVRSGKTSAKQAASQARGKDSTKSAKPKKAKHGLDPEAEQYAPNAAEEWAREHQEHLELQDQHARLKAELASITATDSGKEIKRLWEKLDKEKLRFDQLNGLLQQKATTLAAAQHDAQRYSDLLHKIRKALKVDKPSEILSAIEALRKSK